MDTLRKYYNPPPNLPPTEKEVFGDERVYGGHVFWPYITHPNVEYYPTFEPLKKVRLHLEPDHNMIFQHAPQFYYAPGHSNLDVDLPSS
jgi:hypothetical protein